jgi:hypothetical protein
MNATLKRYPLVAALALVAVVLLAVVALELASGSSLKAGAGASQRVASVEAKLLPPLNAQASEAAYPETGARPLFTPTRRPAPAAANVGASAMNKGQFLLTGVTIAGPLRIALLREKSSGRAVRAEQGREVNGMTVAHIEPDRVTFVQGGDQEVLNLQIQKAAGAPAQAAAAPAGPFANAASAPGGPPPAQPQPVPPPMAANPAGRSAPPGAPVGFGPYPPQTPAEAVAGAAAAAAAASQQTPQSMPLTPDELLARRRARRNQPSQ